MDLKEIIHEFLYVLSFASSKYIIATIVNH